MWNSVRAKLVWWYVLLFGALLLIFCTALYVLIARDIAKRLDLSLSNTAQTAAKLYQGELLENSGNPATAVEHFFNEFRPPHLYVALLQNPSPALPPTSTNITAFASNLEYAHPPGLPAELKPVLPDVAKLAQARQSQRVQMYDADWMGTEGGRLALFAFLANGQPYFVMIAESRSFNAEQLAGLRKIFSITLPLLLLAAGAAGFLFANQALAPVATMTAKAESISAKNLHQRLPAGNERDELGQLARVFNQMLDRLQASFDRMRAFTADASHELRTPLTIIRGEAEVALAQERSPAEYRETLELIQDEAGHLAGLVEDLLALARADAGQRPLEIEELYLNDLVEESCRAVKVLAQAREVNLQYLGAEDIALRGDAGLLRRMILNLLDNALKYTPPKGTVRVQLSHTASHAELQISDTGIGIPADAAGQIFERFYRVDQARSRAAGGSGLGLSIVKWIAEAHHGSVTLESQPGQGSTFRICLPFTA